MCSQFSSTPTVHKRTYHCWEGRGLRKMAPVTIPKIMNQTSAQKRLWDDPHMSSTKQICTTETNSHALIDFTILLYVIYFHSNNTCYKSFFLMASTKPLSSQVFNFWEFYSLERSHLHNLGFTSNPTTSLTSENSSSNASSSSRRRFFSIEVGLLH